MLLLTDICSLVVSCFRQSGKLVDRVSREIQIINSLLVALDTAAFKGIPKRSTEDCWIEVMTVLKWITRSPVGFQTICEFFDQNPEFVCNLFNVFTYGLTTEGENANAYASSSVA